MKKLLLLLLLTGCMTTSQVNVPVKKEVKKENVGLRVSAIIVIGFIFTYIMVIK